MVIILGAIIMDINSCINSLHAYGMKICEICVVFLHPLHSKLLFFKFAIAMSPQNRKYRSAYVLYIDIRLVTFLKLAQRLE